MLFLGKSDKHFSLIIPLLYCVMHAYVLTILTTVHESAHMTKTFRSSNSVQRERKVLKMNNTLTLFWNGSPGRNSCRVLGFGN